MISWCAVLLPHFPLPTFVGRTMLHLITILISYEWQETIRICCDIQISQPKVKIGTWQVWHAGVAWHLVLMKGELDHCTLQHLWPPLHQPPVTIYCSCCPALQHWTPSFLKSHHPLTWNTWRCLQKSTKYAHNHEIQNDQHVIWT